jgi:hypothetical protein
VPLPETALKHCAIAQAVSLQLPAMAARVEAQVSSCGICGGQISTGAGFSMYFGFPCQSFHRLHHIPSSSLSSSISLGWYSRPNSGRSTKWSQSHSTPRNYKKRRKRVMKLFSGIPHSNIVMLVWMSGMSANLCPFRAFLFNFGMSEVT